MSPQKKTTVPPGSNRRHSVLQIGNYPPPVCGWSIQTKLLVEEIRRRGHICEVLNLNENRKKRSNEYVDVQNGFDYLYKLLRFACKGHRFQVHVNGQSKTGYVLALIAALVGRLAGRPVALSWRGGLQQRYFPRLDSWRLRWIYRLLFRLSGQISCNHTAVKEAIQSYGIAASYVVAVPGFSCRHLDFQPVPLPPEIEFFLQRHCPVFFCYVAFRPEYKLDALREAMVKFRQFCPQAAFIWLGFPEKELPAVRTFVHNWPTQERETLLLLGNLPHDQFLVLLSRCFAYIRTPVCDGVSASVLEALALGIPVVASENAHRPNGVMTYRAGDANDLCDTLVELTQRYREIKEQTRLQDADDTIAQTVDWLLGPPPTVAERLPKALVHAS